MSDQAASTRAIRVRVLGVAIIGLLALALAGASKASAASSEGCEGGGFTLLGLSGDQQTLVPAGGLPQTFLVQGKYVEFTVVASTFGIRNYTFTGAPNPLDMTNGVRTVAFAEKTPNHRGLALSGAIDVELGAEDLVISRTGPGLSMKIQAKDCAQGGLFQMEPERGDQTATQITHVLGDASYFDNPNFRAREGDSVPYKDTFVTVPARVNFANDVSPNFVGRDSPQVATRVLQGCVNTVPAPRQPGGTATVDHCGGISVWNVASGGRMGGVFGEDATEVAPPATNCVQNCQAQNQVRGQAVVLGHPFPVPVASRLFPRFANGAPPPPPGTAGGGTGAGTSGGAGTQACTNARTDDLDRAKGRLEKAKSKLKSAKADDGAKRIKQAKAKVNKAKAKVERAKDAVKAC